MSRLTRAKQRKVQGDCPSPLGVWNRAIRRRQAPIAFIACTFFLWSLASVYPRRAAADETPHDESDTPTVAPSVTVLKKDVVLPPVTTSPTTQKVDVASPAEVATAKPGEVVGVPNSGVVPKPGDIASPIKNLVPGTDLGGVDDLKSLPTGADKSGVSSQALSVPQGAGKIQGMGESFSAQLSTGIATFTIPISLLSARGGAQASLALSYSSSGAHGVAGVGWDLSAPFIARQTDRGIPTYSDSSDWTAQQDHFVFNGGQELVPICKVSGGSCAGALSGEVMPSWANGYQYFRPRVEGSFLRFFWSADHQTWKVQNKNGETMELGVPDDGSGYTGGLETDPAKPARVFRWNLTRHYDAHRDSGGKPVNIVAYRYLSLGGVAYLTEVFDTPPTVDASAATFSSYAHHARLRYEARPDPSFGFKRGWRTTHSLRLAGVDITSKTFAADGARELVRRYHLTYDSKYHVSLLTRVQMEGRCTSNPVEDSAGALAAVTGCPSLPAMRMEYQHVEPLTTTGGPGVADLLGYEGFDERIKTIAASPAFSLDEDQTDLFDVNADGLPDVIVTAGGLFGGKHGVFYNGQGGVNDAFGVMGTLRVNSEPVLAAADGNVIKLSNLNVTAGDADGNGIADLIHMPSVKTYGIYTPRRVSGTTSSYEYEWYGRAVTTAAALSPKINFGKDASDIRLMDVNGDGLVDAVYSSGTEMQTFFSLGRFPGGFGQYGNAVMTSATTANISNDPVSRCVPWAGTPVRWSDGEIKIADLNGDRLPDIVKLQKGKIEYWPGRGDGTWGTGDPAACKAGMFSSGTSIVMSSSPWFSEPSVGALRVDDVNGDGLDDLVQIRFADVDVWLNVDGVGWTDRHVIKGSPASPSFLSRTRLVDINGSGTRDVLWGDGFSYKYIDLLGGKRPWVLTRVENGLGKTTELEYETSTQLMAAAEKAGSEWTKKAPMPVQVVVKETVRDNLGSVGRPAGTYVTTYAYRNPVYDGLQREFRGFETTMVTRLGDENSPTSQMASTFLLGECRSGSGLTPEKDPCQPQGAWQDNPREALKGASVVNETYDGTGVYLQTIHQTYTLRELYKGRDGRAVKHAFVSRADTFGYDTGAWSASKSTRTLADVVDESLAMTDNRDLQLQSATGRVRVTTATTLDLFGSTTTSTASGCVEGCSPADEVITTTTTPARPSADTSGWLWRTIESKVRGSRTVGDRYHKRMVYNAAGDRTKTTAILFDTLALDRFHTVSGRAIAPTPASASTSGEHEITLEEIQYDPVGNLTFSAGANGRCRTIGYDTAFQDLATSETVYVGPLTTRTSGGSSFECGNLGLTASAKYDRGLDVVVEMRDLHAELSKVEYDGLGRMTALFKPEPTSVGSASPIASVKFEYLLGDPVSKLHASIHDGMSLTDASYRDSWAFIDGLGRTVATLDEADLSAGDLGAWVVNGLTDFDAKGAARRAYLAWFYGGAPEAFSLSSLPPTGFGRKRYDAFGRVLQTFALDGTTNLWNVYHALSMDAWDAADLTPGPHHGTPNSERRDGHGRVIAITERAHAGSSIEEREIRTDYLSTGETSKISRVRVGVSETPIVRWMKYDSLGRIALNVEPDTTKNFSPDPATDPATMKAWRYAWNDAGDLVGTSDPRGCGTNYHYDAAGRVIAEDYSPCNAHHPLYSAPVFTPGAETGIEVLNRYDYAPGDKATITSADSACVINDALYPGRLVEVWDRGSRMVNVFDGRGRVTCKAMRMAEPGSSSDTLADRYAARWYVRTASFDAADRPILESTGAKVVELLGGDGESSVATTYTARGSVRKVDGSYGTLFRALTHDADGLTSELVYGDIASTTTAFDYDLKRRVRSVQTYRGPPSIWSSGAITPTSATGTLQLVLEDLDFGYDNADNPIEIRDWRKPDDWPAGSKPVTRKLAYDDLYRLTKITYQYGAGYDGWVSPLAAENAGAGGATTDPRMAKPAPQVAFDRRVLWQSFQHDWLGNTTKTEDDVSGFYDRSLGTISNGTATLGPYQLKSASSTSGTRSGALTAKYDDGGFLVSMAVRRDGPCLPTGAQCSQRLVYDWDEAGRLQRARRWDLAATSVGTASDPEPSSTPAVELRYQYNARDERTLKTAIDPATSAERHTVYVFASLELRRTTWDGSDFARTAYTEVPYLFAGGVRVGRIAYEDADVPSVIALAKPRLHVFFEFGDQLGSTSIVIDKDTSELVEKSSFTPFGGADSDYRPARWKAFREDYRFTGKEEDIEVGLTYFGLRYLAPSMGRWISPDPLALQKGGGGDANLYAYVLGQLLRRKDLLGLDGNLDCSQSVCWSSPSKETWCKATKPPPPEPPKLTEPIPGGKSLAQLDAETAERMQVLGAIGGPLGAGAAGYLGTKLITGDDKLAGKVAIAFNQGAEIGMSIGAPFLAKAQIQSTTAAPDTAKPAIAPDRGAFRAGFVDYFAKSATVMSGVPGGKFTVAVTEGVTKGGQTVYVLSTSSTKVWDTFKKYESQINKMGFKLAERPVEVKVDGSKKATPDSHAELLGIAKAKELGGTKGEVTVNTTVCDNCKTSIPDGWQVAKTSK